MVQTVKHLSTMRETLVRALGWEDPLEKEMATHSSTLAWKIPWTEEPGKLQSMGSQSWTRLSDFTFLFFLAILLTSLLSAPFLSGIFSSTTFQKSERKNINRFLSLHSFHSVHSIWREAWRAAIHGVAKSQTRLSYCTD